MQETFTTTDILASAPAGDIAAAWAENISSAIDKAGGKRIEGVGFAMPGPFDYMRGISRIAGVSKFSAIFGLDVKHTLLQWLDGYDIPDMRFINDAGAFALGEASAGSGKGVGRLFVATLGTGFGSAFVVGGEVVSEGEGVPHDGCVYYFPFRGKMADDMFSTRWFTGRYEELTGNKAQGVKEIADAVGTVGAASAVFEEYGSNMGEFLAPILIDFGAESIVFGGNIAKAYDHFGPYLRDGLAGRGVDIPVHISGMMDRGAIIGAANLFNV